jgi:hypothetical protein
MAVPEVRFDFSGSNNARNNANKALNSARSTLSGMRDRKLRQDENAVAQERFDQEMQLRQRSQIFAEGAGQRQVDATAAKELLAVNKRKSVFAGGQGIINDALADNQMTPEMLAMVEQMPGYADANDQQRQQIFSNVNNNVGLNEDPKLLMQRADQYIGENGLSLEDGNTLRDSINSRFSSMDNAQVQLLLDSENQNQSEIATLLGKGISSGGNSAGNRTSGNRGSTNNEKSVITQSDVIKDYVSERGINRSSSGISKGIDFFRLNNKDVTEENLRPGIQALEQAGVSPAVSFRVLESNGVIVDGEYNNSLFNNIFSDAKPTLNDLVGTPLFDKIVAEGLMMMKSQGSSGGIDSEQQMGNRLSLLRASQAESSQRRNQIMSGSGRAAGTKAMRLEEYTNKFAAFAKESNSSKKEIEKMAKVMEDTVQKEDLIATDEKIVVENNVAKVVKDKSTKTAKSNSYVPTLKNVKKTTSNFTDSKKAIVESYENSGLEAPKSATPGTKEYKASLQSTLQKSHSDNKNAAIRKKAEIKSAAEKKVFDRKAENVSTSKKDIRYLTNQLKNNKTGFKKVFGVENKQEGEALLKNLIKKQYKNGIFSREENDLPNEYSLEKLLSKIKDSNNLNEKDIMRVLNKK